MQATKLKVLWLRAMVDSEEQGCDMRIFFVRMCRFNFFILDTIYILFLIYFNFWEKDI